MSRLLICEEVLENMLLDSEGNQKVPPAPLNPQDAQGCVYHASLLIANELKSVGSGLQDRRKASTMNCQSNSGGSEDGISSEILLPRKRKRNGTEYQDLNLIWSNLDDEDAVPPLPSEAMLEVIVETYFSKVQPWIPFLHMPTFRTRLKDQRERAKIKVLLHAIVSSTMKHLKPVDFVIDQAEVRRQVRVSRNVVTLHAMGSLSVENLQALIVLAFDYVSYLLSWLFPIDVSSRWEEGKFPKHGQSLGLCPGQWSIFNLQSSLMMFSNNRCCDRSSYWRRRDTGRK
jgi:hypothetical protein